VLRHRNSPFDYSLSYINYGSAVVAGETDWKVIAIDITDPLANDLNGLC